MSDKRDHEQTDKEMLTRLVRDGHRPSEVLAEAGKAFDRVTVSRVPRDRTGRPWGRPWHVEVQRPADETHVATVEHMDLDRDELVALADRIWEVLSS